MLYVIRKNNHGGTATAFLIIFEAIFTWLVFESKIILSAWENCLILLPHMLLAELKTNPGTVAVLILTVVSYSYPPNTHSGLIFQTTHRVIWMFPKWS